jgi:hypothetical protein
MCLMMPGQMSFTIGNATDIVVNIAHVRCLRYFFQNGALNGVPVNTLGLSESYDAVIALLGSHARTYKLSVFVSVHSTSSESDRHPLSGDSR